MAAKKPTKPAPKKVPKKPAVKKPVPVKKPPVKKPPKRLPVIVEVPPEEEELPSHPPEEEPAEEVPVEPAADEVPAETPVEPPKEKPKEEDPLSKIDREQLLSFIEVIIDILTFKRVALVALLVIAAIVLFSLYENRTALVQRLTGPKAAPTAPVVTEWVLSDASKANLQALARTTDVSFIAVTDVDLPKNRRTVRYYYIDDPAVKLTPVAQQSFSLPQAVFDYDAKNTVQMVSILSNEFRCDDFKDTVYFRYAPELVENLPTICRIAIPPFVGQFVGFITVGMGRQMTKVELDSIRLEVSRLAVEIYLNDVIKKPGTAPAN